MGMESGRNLEMQYVASDETSCRIVTAHLLSTKARALPKVVAGASLARCLSPEVIGKVEMTPGDYFPDEVCCPILVNIVTIQHSYCGGGVESAVVDRGLPLWRSFPPVPSSIRSMRAINTERRCKTRAAPWGV